MTRGSAPLQKEDKNFLRNYNLLEIIQQLIPNQDFTPIHAKWGATDGRSVQVSAAAIALR
jgi:hypothetical protein